MICAYVFAHTYIHIYKSISYVYVYLCVCVYTALHSAARLAGLPASDVSTHTHKCMGWQRYRALLQKRTIILRGLLAVAAPYMYGYAYISFHIHPYAYISLYIHTQIHVCISYVHVCTCACIYAIAHCCGPLL